MAAAPDAPQRGPAPAPSRRSSRSRLAPANWLPVTVLALLALAVVVATAGVVVWALTSDEGDDRPAAGQPRSDAVPRPSFDEAASTSATEAPSTDPSATTELDPSTTVPPGGGSSHPVIGPGGAFTMTVPAGWTGAAMGEDPAGAARAAFPDDPSKADLFELVLDTFVVDPDRAGGVPATHFAAIDGEGLGVETLAEMAIITGDAVPGVDLATAQSAMRANALAGGGELVESGRLETALGAWAWQETIPGEDVGAADLRLVEYVIVVDERLWHITFWSDELPSERATADAIVESFRPR